MLSLDMLPWAVVACVLVRLAFAAATRARLESQLSLARDELADSRGRVNELEQLAMQQRDAALVAGGEGLQDVVHEIVARLEAVEKRETLHTDVTIS